MLKSLGIIGAELFLWIRHMPYFKHIVISDACIDFLMIDSIVIQLQMYKNPKQHAGIYQPVNNKPPSFA